MELIRPVDAYATEERVRKFFKYEWERLVIMSGSSMTDLKSPSFSADPKAQNLDNAAESKLIMHIDAGTIVKDVIRTINTMPDKYQFLLKARYIKGLTWLNIEEQLPYTNRDLQRKINTAFLYFADGFKAKDLHVYMEEIEP